MNEYAKLLRDFKAAQRLSAAESRVLGFCNFNVYGPGEAHKGRKASVVHHLNRQLKTDGKVRLLEGSYGVGDGEQPCDFVYVDNVVRVGLWFLDHPDESGVFNFGNGRSQTFNQVADAVIAWHGRGEIEYIPFSAALKRRYHGFTEADIGALRQFGYHGKFSSLEDGVCAFLDALKTGR